MADSLRDELLSIPGIEEAELEGEGPTPAGVRVRLSADADTDTVGEEVRRVLATHGMRSHVATPPEQEAPPPPPGAPASVVRLPGVSIAPPPVAAADDTVVFEQPIADSEAPAAAAPAPVPDRAAAAELPAPPAAVAGAGRPHLQSVAVEEGRDGVIVRVAAGGGAIAERKARPGEAGLDAAIVSAVGQLMDPMSAPPRVMEILDHEVAGTRLVTVVLERGDGSRCAGSAVADGGRVYAVGYAAWVALSDG